MSSLLTKDEILEQADVVWCPEVEIQRSDVHEAMDIYAKQECIAFAEWCENSYHKKTKIWTGTEWVENYTTKQLYSLYQQSK